MPSCENIFIPSRTRPSPARYYFFPFFFISRYLFFFFFFFLVIFHSTPPVLTTRSRWHARKAPRAHGGALENHTRPGNFVRMGWRKSSSLPAAGLYMFIPGDAIDPDRRHAIGNTLAVDQTQLPRPHSSLTHNHQARTCTYVYVCVCAESIRAQRPRGQARANNLRVCRRAARCRHLYY